MSRGLFHFHSLLLLVQACNHRPQSKKGWKAPREVVWTIPLPTIRTDNGQAFSQTDPIINSPGWH